MIGKIVSQVKNTNPSAVFWNESTGYASVETVGRTISFGIYPPVAAAAVISIAACTPTPAKTSMVIHSCRPRVSSKYPTNVTMKNVKPVKASILYSTSPEPTIEMTNIAREILVCVIESGRVPRARRTRGVTARSPAIPVVMIGIITAIVFHSTLTDKSISPST